MKNISFYLLNVLFLFAIVFFGLSDTVPAEYILNNTSPNPVGSGARALGMGGAFIGVADDATAASWNPGGMTQLKKSEISLVGRVVDKKETYEVNDYSSAIENINFNCNYLSVVLPFSLKNRNMVFALNYQQLYDYNLEIKFKTFIPNNQGSLNLVNIEYKRTGYLSPVGVAYSIQVIPEVSIGVTMNFWRNFWGINQIKETYNVSSDFIYESNLIHQENTVKYDTDFKGFNTNYGIFCRPFAPLSIGAVYKSSFKADIKMKYSQTQKIQNNLTHYPSRDIDLNFEMPESYGIGVAYKFTDTFKMSFDIYKTRWSKYIVIDSERNEYSGITGELNKNAEVDDTIQLRTGSEWLCINKNKQLSIPIRFGFFYDPIPDQGSPIDVFGISTGTGYSTPRYAFDIFYQYKKSYNETSMENKDDWIPKEFYEHMAYISVIFYLL